MIGWIVSAALALGPQGAPAAAPVVRPRDPWVFRSVLDERPRMVTIALSDQMWIAYDATHCGLYRAWKGDVAFEGAVYTTQHGPQPRSRGPSYVEGYELEPGESLWEATYPYGPDTVTESLEVVWRGYRIDGTRKVTLMYDVLLPENVADGKAVRVEESPEYIRPMDRFNEQQIEAMGVPSTHPGLVRTFRVVDPPAGVKLTVRLQTGGALHQKSLGLERLSVEQVETEDGGSIEHVHSRLVLSKARAVNYLLMIFAPRPETAEEAR